MASKSTRKKKRILGNFGPWKWIVLHPQDQGWKIIEGNLQEDIRFQGNLRDSRKLGERGFEMEKNLHAVAAGLVSGRKIVATKNYNNTKIIKWYSK